MRVFGSIEAHLWQKSCWLAIHPSKSMNKGCNMCSLYLNSPLCDALTSKSAMHSKGRPSRHISDVCSSKSRGEMKVSIMELWNRCCHLVIENWPTCRLVLMSLICHSAALMYITAATAYYIAFIFCPFSCWLWQIQFATSMRKSSALCWIMGGLSAVALSGVSGLVDSSALRWCWTWWWMGRG